MEGGSTLNSQAIQTVIGDAPGSTGAVTVTGRGTNWTHNGWLAIGQDRAGNGLPAANGTLTISDQASVAIVGSGQQLDISRYGGTGTLIVTAGGKLSMPEDTSIVSYEGQSTITVDKAGSIVSGDVFLSANAGGVTTAKVDGPSSTWIVNGSTEGFYVAGWDDPSQSTAQATVTVSGGGSIVVNNGGGFIVGAFGTGVATVTDPGSWLEVSGGTVVGGGSTGNGTLNITNGGHVQTAYTIVAFDPAASGTVNLTGGTLETFELGAGAGVAQVNFNGGTLRAIGDNANFITGFSGTELNLEAGGLTIDDAGHNVANEAVSVFTGTGGLTKIGSGTFNLVGTNTYQGATTINAGTLLVNGSILSPSTVMTAGTLGGTGQVGNVTNFGTVSPGNSIGTLTVAGDYVGQGGKLAIETVLGGDNSSTDLLVVTGATSGNTNVQVTNLGGGGAQTTEGIKIIDVGGASNGQFTLLGHYTFAGQPTVVGGAYAYRLYKNGVSTPGDGDWYLRSGLEFNPQQLEPGPVIPPNPGPAPTPTPTPQPLYQPGVPIYEAYAQVLQELNGVGTLRQRVGNRYWGGAANPM
ncbi:hypothetical protein C5748_23985, partial [Phyllobacterium phragmitis]